MGDSSLETTVRCERGFRDKPTLHSLPAEVIERVLLFSDPRDISRYAQTCSFARKLVYDPEDQFLWRELYLGRPFDDLRKAVPVPAPHPGIGLPLDPATPHAVAGDDAPAGLHWRLELQRRTEAEIIAASGDGDAALLHRAFSTFLAAVDTALPVTDLNIDAPGPDGTDSPVGSAPDPSPSENLRWLERVLRQTRVLDRPVQPPLTGASPAPLAPKRELRPMKGRDTRVDADAAADALVAEAHQLRCRLRAAVALAHETDASAEGRARMAELRRASRCFVYDMRRYAPGTLWGPYRVVPTPGKPRRTLVVNWEHVEHIMNVVALKLRDIPHSCLGFYHKPLFTLEALRPNSAVGAAGRPVHDWAGVTGKWRRFVCFMDYRYVLLNRLTHVPPARGPHHPSFFDAPFDEALRPVELHLALIPEREYFADASQIPHVLPLHPPAADGAHGAFPTLYFEGRSHGPHASVATIRGNVGTLADGAVRWQFVTTYDGRMQWSAEGVQVGHACSAAGIAGIWTGAHHERDDPAGPFWMVKVDDELPEGILNSLH
ncbi:hypothetical protein BD413DRAFT_486453 [Trametes elegans]|nr:hypothetical protein BD413DRAFT_486453 [Trametes elegans]